MKATFLSHFTPSLMAPEALEAVFVQRQSLAQRLVKLVRDSALTLSKHYALLIGPRGIGKTHLIALIYHRIHAMDDLRDCLIVAWLREEEWGVTSFLDLLLRIFRALLAEHDDPTLAARVETLYDMSPSAAERAGGEFLREFVGNRTLLILVENLDGMFEGLGEEGQKRLRAYLQENPFCTILATAQSLFHGVSLQTSPFYGFFRIHHLGELEIDEAMHLLENIASYEGDRELALFIPTPMGRARIRAIHHLAGGNHRIYVIFSQFLTRESLDELVEPFMHTLDDLTPYYQARMAWLSPQQRKIIEFLCDRRHPVPVKEVAQRCFMSHQTASGQLKILRQMGYVHSIPVGRESYYELHEPLMRLCVEVKKNRGEPIRLFVDFLRLWYSPVELQQRLELLDSDAILEREYVLHALRVTKEMEDPRLAACLRDCNDYFQRGNFNHALKVAEELVAIRGHAKDWCEQGHCLIHLRRWDEALASLDKAIKLDPINGQTWSYRGMALGNLRRYDEALASFDEAIKQAPNDAEAWFNRGLILSNLRRYDEALASFDKVIKLDPANVQAWSYRGMVWGDLRRYDEALASFDEVIKQAPNDAEAWLYRGRVLGNLGRYDEALMAYNKAIELKPNDADIWLYRGVALDDLQRYDEALASFDEVIKWAPNDAHVWFHRGLTLGDLQRYDEALVSFDEVIKRASNDVKAWLYRGRVLGNLGRYDEALTAYDKAIELKPNDARIWNSQSVALGNLGRYDESLVSCNKAIELGDQSSNVFFNRSEALLALNHWDEGYAALDDALDRFARGDQPVTGDTGAIVRNLFNRIQDVTIWQAHITTLLELYAKHKVLPALAQGLVHSMSALTSSIISDATARTWRDEWQARASDRTEFQLPLRLLDVAVRYRETNDPRILLELPVEERTIVEELLHEVKEAR